MGEWSDHLQVEALLNSTSHSLANHSPRVDKRSSECNGPSGYERRSSEVAHMKTATPVGILLIVLGDFLSGLPGGQARNPLMLMATALDRTTAFQSCWGRDSTRSEGNISYEGCSRQTPFRSPTPLTDAS